MSIPLFKVHIDESRALKEIQNVFLSGFINEGSQVIDLTKKLSRYLNAECLMLVNSCTSALTLALKLAGVGWGDEVISTPMTCVASNTPIVNLGAKIVWADIDPMSGMIDPEDVKRKITSKTKAVMAVAWGGTPPNLADLNSVCKTDHDIKLILDAAHAFDAYYLDSPAHVWADYTCYSFQAIKHFTTGDGGALVCADPSDHKRAKALKWFGLDRDLAKDANGNWKGRQWDADIEEAGYKFNMNNVAAAIGLSQLQHITRIVATHRHNARLYDHLLRDCSNVVPLTRPVHAESSFWTYGIRVTNKSSRSRDELIKSLLDLGKIDSGIMHVPNNDYTAFAAFQTQLPGVKQFANEQLALPCGWWVTENDVHMIANLVKNLTK